jgi:hypothetical protein
MLPWIEIVFNGFAILSTIVATLRAGSRILYISEHQSIGVMNGPLILPPSVTTNITNQNIPLYELSENFKHCVRLSIVPNLYTNVKHQVPVNADDTSKRKNGEKLFSKRYRDPFEHQPYTLGANAYKPKKFKAHGEAKSESDNHDDSITIAMDDEELAVKELEHRLENELITSFAADRAMNHTRKKSRWTNPFQRRTTRKPHRNDESLSSLSSRWDYGQATEADFFYNITSASCTATDDIMTQQRRRLAELSVYSPKVFANLRSIFGISEDSYLKSILFSGPFVSFQSNSKGSARAGGVFFFTRDGSYMIKSIKDEEAETLQNILPKYHRHMKRYGRSSLLTRFCGMYQVVIEEEEGNLDMVIGEVDSSLAPTGKVQTFVVMNSAFPAEANRFISERFDLKGSTVGREVSEEELRSKGSNAVLKDLDLAREVNLMKSKGGKGYGLNIGASAKAALLSQLREDVKLLVDCHVMDVS